MQTEKLYADLDITYDEYQKLPFTFIQRHALNIIGAVMFAGLVYVTYLVSVS